MIHHYIFLNNIIILQNYAKPRTNNMPLFQRKFPNLIFLFYSSLLKKEFPLMNICHISSQAMACVRRAMAWVPRLKACYGMMPRLTACYGMRYPRYTFIINPSGLHSQTPRPGAVEGLGTTHECGGCDQSIESTVSDAIVRSWLWSTVTRSFPLDYFSNYCKYNSSTSFCFLRSSSCRTDLSIHFQPSRPTTIWMFF